MIKEAIDEVKLRIKLDSFILILSINEYKDSPELILPQSLKKGIYGIHLYHICIFINKMSCYTAILALKRIVYDKKKRVSKIKKTIIFVQKVG